MAGFQYATPRPVFPSRPKRRFTLGEANKTLPLVKRIVADIVRTHGQVNHLHQCLETTTAARDQDKLQTQLDQEVEHLQEYVDELAELGCELKDYESGLIDFVGRHQGRDVYLCWKLGEDKIGYWHELHAGFSGRQPIAALKESE